MLLQTHNSYYSVSDRSPGTLFETKAAYTKPSTYDMSKEHNWLRFHELPNRR